MTDTTGPAGPRPSRSVPLWRQRPYQIGAAVVAVVLVGAGIAVALAGGGSGTPVASTTVPTTEAPATTTTTVPGPPAPLTGLPSDDPAIFERPVLIVKIDDTPTSRRPDQAGVEVADVVYEEPVEGTTRLVALFHSQAPERVGPIRSTRYIDAGIVWPFGHVPYVYSGGTPPKVAAIRSAPVQTFDETALAGIEGARIRDPDIPAPHNLFTVPTAMWGAAEATAPPAPLFAYLADGERFGGDPVATVAIPTLNRSFYAWDAPSGTWRRSQQCRPRHECDDTRREPHVGESGDPVAPANLIVQRISGTQRESVVGDGEAWVCSQGRMVHGRWERPTLEDVTRFVDDAGAPIALTPGITWVHLITSGEPETT